MIYRDCYIYIYNYIYRDYHIYIYIHIKGLGIATLRIEKQFDEISVPCSFTLVRSKTFLTGSQR